MRQHEKRRVGPDSAAVDPPGTGAKRAAVSSVFRGLSVESVKAGHADNGKMIPVHSLWLRVSAGCALFHGNQWGFSATVPFRCPKGGVPPGLFTIWCWTKTAAGLFFNRFWRVFLMKRMPVPMFHRQETIC